MKGFIIFLLILWVLWFFRARIQVWLLGHILRRVQERMGQETTLGSNVRQAEVVVEAQIPAQLTIRSRS